MSFNRVIICEVTDKKNRVEIDKDNLSVESYKNTIDKFIAPCELVGSVGQQTKAYFDVDKKYEEFDDSIDDSVRIMDYKLHIQNAFHEKFNDVHIDFNDIYSIKRDEDPDKFSVHFTIDKMRITACNLETIVKEAGLQDLGFDTGVYDKDRKLHCIYTHTKVQKVSKEEDPKGYKYIQKKQFLPIEKAHISKFLVSYIEETFYDMDTKFPKIQEKKIVKESNLKKLVCYKNDKELAFISRLVLECLSYNRADNYEDWLHLGWCLHNIDNRLLDLWIEFSQKSNKYEDGVCEDYWNKSKNRGGLTLGSLKFWAKTDNKNIYDNIMSDQLAPYIDKSIRGDGSHSDIAEMISLLMKDKIVYDTKVKSWFIVNDKTNIWEQDKEGVKVRKILSTCGCNVYLQRVQYWNTLQFDDNDDDDKKSIYTEKAKTALKIAAQLKNAGFKDSVMKELKSWCVQDDFIEVYLDCNINLFAFKNGVYDLSTNEFRNIESTDYISTTTGYDYDANIDDKYKDVIINFLKSTQKTDEMYKYLLDVITSMIYGKNYQQEFYIFNGKGANGKSVLMALLSLVFGNYANKINATTFTKPSRGANETSEMHSCKSSRLVMVEEPEETDSLITSRLKEFSGDGKIKTRGLHENAFSFDPQFGIIFFCNQIPALSKVDNAIGRRLRLVDFPFKFCDNPTQSNEKLIDRNLNTLFKDNIEYRQAFALIILKHWEINKLNQEKLQTPVEVLKVTENYMDDCNEVKKFINEFYEITDNENDYISCRELYVWFKQKTGSKTDEKSFAYNMDELGISKKKTKACNKYIGIKEKDDKDE